MDYIIREASPGDARALLSYVKLLLSEPGLDIPLQPGEFKLSLEEEEHILADYAASDNSVFLLAESQGSIIGALNLKGSTRQALRHSAFLGISVKRGWRDQGVGDALMRSAMDWARESGVIKRVELYVYARNQRAVHLYEKHGFKIEGRRQRAIYQGGKYLDDLLMARLF